MNVVYIADLKLPEILHTVSTDFALQKKLFQGFRATALKALAFTIYQISISIQTSYPSDYCCSCWLLDTVRCVAILYAIHLS
ncbi:dubious [Schizosaccharomyces pombe]|uniref:Putative uncharacterized protein C9G1.14 n=1 Tax=Schizosaccharomyces pombe (strain 972 / ATCC 24843) TaxID=284812 RepID=YE8E_SCHPO|nr:uncharacterized protein SPAC9G1.14 [Schizosaccharomyces pombe]G2TRK6.1 RecName: Full=Putative uncharacterized protein C9G1.14 [Schizosaccharomyces pombe 972h-]CCD31315.1 dubious [Schizosaccharomyces pombe]|eukprot:NP_001343105.1 uncharacterized protein SPAC9G1.14 [Schizosaccharomyces pombe]